MRSKTKRILAFLCAVVLVATSFLGSWYTKQVEAAIEPKPIQLDGFENVTLNDFVDGSGNKMQPGEYRSDKNGGVAWDPFYSLSGGSLDKKLVSMKIKYHGGNEHQYSLVFGGKGTYSSFNLRPSGNGQTLYIDSAWAGSIIDKSNYDVQYMEASKAGLDSFIGEEFLLQMSFEYGEVVDGKTTLTIGMYINGQPYSGGKLTIPNCNVSALSAGLGVYVEYTNNQVAVITLDNVSFPAEPIQLDGFENVTLSDFVDGNGNAMQSGEYRSDKNGGVAWDPFYSLSGGSLDKKLVSMKIKYHGGNEHQYSLMFGGKGTYSSFNLRPSGNGQTLYVDSTWAGSIIDKSSYNPPYMEASKAGLDSFIGEEFLLQMSFEYGEVVDGKTTLTIGMYINGKLYNNEKFTISNCNVNALSAGLGVYVEYTNNQVAVITLGNVEFSTESEPSEPSQPSDPLEGYDEVSVEDFVDASGKTMESKAYPYITDNTETFHLKEHENFDNKVLSMNVKFLRGDSDTRLEVGGVGAWSGLGIFVSSDGNYLFVADTYGKLNSATPNFPMEIHKDSVGVTSFINTPFLLQMSFKYVDFDSNGTVDQILLGVYVEGNLYNEQLYTLNVKDINNFGNCINLDRENVDSVIIVSSINNEIFPVVPGQQPNENLEKVTFAQFGIADNEYKYNGDIVVKGNLKNKDSIAGTVLRGDIKLSEIGHFQVIYGGGQNVWEGIRLITDNDGGMHVYWYEDSEGQHITSFDFATAGVKFQNVQYTLMISTELVDNDIKLGIWFNEVLYNDEYITIPNKGDKLGNTFAVYCAGSNSSVIIASDPELKGDDPEMPSEPQQPDESFEKLTFAHFGVKDGTYKFNGDIVVRGRLKGKDTLDKTVICGDILLEGKPGYQLIFGGKDDAWDGLRLILDTPDAIHLYWFGEAGGQYITSFTPIGAGVEFVREEFNLMLSTEVVGNDIKVGVWFDGVLYGNQYITISDCADELGNRFAGYCSSEDASIVLNSIPELAPPVEPPKQPNENFEKITFEYFGVKDGIYKCDGTAAPTYEGKGNESLDQKVLCGDILFSGTGENHLMVGGNGNTWYGLRFITQKNETIVLYWIDEEGLKLVEIFDATTAGTALVDEWINLVISTEIVDADGDGAKDDIELGVWFNGVLYQEQFYTILDKASGLGKTFGFDCAGEDNTISIRSIPELVKGFDFSVFGYTKEWQKTLLTDHKAETAVGGSRDPEPFTGDLLEVGKVCLFGTTVIVAIAACIYAVLQRKKES